VETIRLETKALKLSQNAFNQEAAEFKSLMLFNVD